MGKFRHSVAGGTFDHLHDGHKDYLKRASEQTEHLSIGLTSDGYIKRSDKELKELIQPYEERKRGLECYLGEMGYSESSRIFRIEDEFGDTLANGSYEAVFVSSEGGAKNAEKINACREKRGMKPLEIVRVQVLVGADGERISSTAIRRSIAGGS